MGQAAQDRLILASGSPRRKTLLIEHGYDFDVVRPSDSAETGRLDGESPTEMVARLAVLKARDVATRFPKGVFLGSDTVAECHGDILGKPRDRDDARRMLRLMRGQEHRVYSSICLWHRPSDRQHVEVAHTVLRMLDLEDHRIESYLDTDQWKGKAGAFGFQDGLDWIEIVDGETSTVVGLPMELLATRLREFAPDMRFRQGG